MFDEHKAKIEELLSSIWHTLSTEPIPCKGCADKLHELLRQYKDEVGGINFGRANHTKADGEFMWAYFYGEIKDADKFKQWVVGKNFHPHTAPRMFLFNGVDITFMSSRGTTMGVIIER